MVVVAYWASLDPGQDELASVLSTEHGHVGLFNRTEVDQLLMPAGYRPSVTGW